MKIFLPNDIKHFFFQEHIDVLEAFNSVECPDTDDVLVTFGVHKSKTHRGQHTGAAINRHRGRHLVIEKGFVKRNIYYMIGWGGLNGRANFMNDDSPADRS